MISPRVVSSFVRPSNRRSAGSDPSASSSPLACFMVFHPFPRPSPKNPLWSPSEPDFHIERTRASHPLLLCIGIEIFSEACKWPSDAALERFLLHTSMFAETKIHLILAPWRWVARGRGQFSLSNSNSSQPLRLLCSLLLSHILSNRSLEALNGSN